MPGQLSDQFSERKTLNRRRMENRMVERRSVQIVVTEKGVCNDNRGSMGYIKFRFGKEKVY
jgi:hypothetical protein